VCDGADNDCSGVADDASLEVMCPLPENAIDVTCGGQAGCLATCLDGFDDCDPDASSPCDTDTMSSALHCGRCDYPCDDAPGDYCVSGECQPRILWVFANYNGEETTWDPGVMWNGTISCGTTCGYVGRPAVGMRFICNLAGDPDQEGCTAATDGQYGAANCGLWIDEGVLSNNGNTENCSSTGDLFLCLTASCDEYVVYHAIECQCGAATP
jgi:hypothetical protein